MGGAGRAGLARIALAGGALSTLLTLACAGAGLEIADGRLRDPRLGYSLEIPPDPPWRRLAVEEADAAYRGPGPVYMSLVARCDRPLAEPRIMARHLVIGLPERTLRQSGAVAVGPWPGWFQVFDTLQDDAVVRIKTVTLVTGRCSFDWVLSGRGGFERAEPAFDAWWQSFRYDGPAHAGAAGEFER